MRIGGPMRISAKQWLYLPKMISQEVMAKNFLELKTSIPSSKKHKGIQVGKYIHKSITIKQKKSKTKPWKQKETRHCFQWIHGQNYS